ncbi:hypothetical protein JMJ35_010597 [Cladonia borealis]|uniref:1-alkyl-2-acetylglycerophosphocholine esterase n=1 Tax=Cladonia borealis TaxID=184061 RepID=A0AA39QPT1_9LECA|nr:hypothetical protein JMJ35_010597 [Cladonia borealis]
MHFSRYVSLCFITTSSLLLTTTAKADQVLLPKPDGAFEVGLSTMELIDKSRLQLFAPSVQQRHFMVSLFYPIHSRKSTTPANYMPPETAAFEDGSELSTTGSAGLVSPNGTFERLALQVAGKSPQTQGTLDFPIVLFSPGEATTRLFYSVIAQTIASSGYIVITMDAPHDVDIVEYPDGSVDLINTTVTNAATIADADLAVSVRAQDASFVLDQLCNNASVVSQLIPGSSHGLDVRNVAMFGHSLGGAATAAAMLNDSRIAGGIAMDGTLYGPVVQEGLDRPFMLMAHTNHTRVAGNGTGDADSSWFNFWANLRGFKLDIMLANSLHYTFSDVPIVLETLGIVPNATIATNLQVTDLNGSRALQIVTTYVTAFLDKVLKYKTSPLLQGPVAAFPEVTFER